MKWRQPQRWRVDAMTDAGWLVYIYFVYAERDAKTETEIRKIEHESQIIWAFKPLPKARFNASFLGLELILDVIIPSEKQSKLTQRYFSSISFFDRRCQQLFMGKLRVATSPRQFPGLGNDLTN